MKTLIAHRRHRLVQRIKPAFSARRGELVALLLLLVAAAGISAGAAESNLLRLNARSRVESRAGSGEYQAVEKTLEWDPAKTAVIICDMWDRHWCKGATARVAEMAPRMNEVIQAARRRGVFIIHCPSSTMEFYKDTPQRKLAQAAPKTAAKIPLDLSCGLDPNRESPLPIDDSDGGCDDSPQCPGGGPWRRQIETIEIAPGDAITDSVEAYYLMAQRGIENVIIMGVHINMCVLGRPFSIRQMVRQGKNVVLMRDLTDAMYNSRRRPNVSHFAGNDLVVEHIERYWCPSITSADLAGGKPFRFQADRRPKIVFVIGENEYQTEETLPAFARQELEWRGFDCRFVLAPKDAGDPNFKNFEAIADADLLCISVRRRTPPKEMLELIRRHVAAGKPVVGIRTASHAFDAKPPDDRYAAWPQFDAQVLGGNYRGHYNNKPPKDPPTLVKVIPAAIGHPVLLGVPTTEFSVTSHLYKNSKPAGTVVPLLSGHVKGRPEEEPVAWVNTNASRRVFYTSLGNPEDFRLPAFRRLLLNGILWTLDQPIPPNAPVYAALWSARSAPAAPAEKAVPAAPPKAFPSAAEAVKLFKVDPQLELDLVAAEPDVAQPVYLTFDERGRMWVVQYLQYPFPAGLKVVGHDEYWRVKYDHFPPPPPPKHVPGADKVTIFEDKDGDGRFESHKDFVTGLNITTAALPGRDGVWVMNPPYLLFYPDRNHDDVPDADPVVHLAGFGLEDMHAVANSLTWGPDGWLYGCQGSTCTATITRPGLDEPGMHFKGQCVWRYHPETRRFEIFAEGGFNNFGIAVDQKWRLFTGSNGGVIGVHYVQGGYYRKNWAKHGPLTNPNAFGYFESMPDRSSRAKLSQAMAFCETDQWPAEFQGKLIVARVMQQRLDLCELRPDGSTYSANELRPVLSATDKHFRPVDLKLGPDGGIYIADWHEPNVTWNVTAEGGGLRQESGRIYRLRPKGARPAPAAPVDYSKASPERLLQTLAHSNQWHRLTAQRLLRERHPSELIPRLTQQLKQTSGQPALEALWALHACGGFTDEVALRQLEHPDPFVRLWTVRLLGDDRRAPVSVVRKLVELSRKERDPQVLSQLVCTVRRLPLSPALPVFELLVNRTDSDSDPHLPLLLWWVFEDKLRTDRAEVLRWVDASPLWRAPVFRSTVIPRLAQRFTAERTEENFKTCSRLLAMAGRYEQTSPFIHGMALGLAGNRVEKVPTELAEVFREVCLEHNPNNETIEVAVRLGVPESTPLALSALANEATPEKERISLLRLLSERAEPGTLSTILRLLREPASATLKAEALAAAQHFSDDHLAQAILEQLAGFSSTLRDKGLTILSSRKAWALLLLAAVDRGQLNPKLVPRDVVLAIQNVGSDEAKAAIAKHWGAVNRTPDEKRQRIQQIRAFLGKGRGDNSAGRTIFDQTCAKCHTLFGNGQKIGPDLTGIDRANTDILLGAIVDPSAAVLPEYMGFQLRLKPKEGEDEQVLTGFIVEENANRLALMDASGTQINVARQEILERRPLSLSIMPEGLLDAYSDQQVRDLFAYLQSSPPAK